MITVSIAYLWWNGKLCYHVFFKINLEINLLVLPNVRSGPQCQTEERCTNKRFQRREYCNLEIFKTEKKGHGLRTRQALARLAYSHKIKVNLCLAFFVLCSQRWIRY